MSCCGSLFVNLGGGGGGGTIATGVLQIAGGVALDSTLRFVEDQNGTDSILKLSTGQVAVLSGASNLTVFHQILNSNGVGWQFAQIDSNYLGLYSTNVTPSSSNYSLRTNTTQTGVNATNNLWFGISENALLTITTNGVFVGAYNTSPAARLDIIGDNINPIIRFANSTNVEQGNINNSGKLTIKEIEVETGFTAKYNSTKIIEAVQVSGSTGLGFFAAPAIVQPTTSISNATYANVSGTEIKENDTFDGYTVGQVVQALRNLGLLA